MIRVQLLIIFSMFWLTEFVFSTKVQQSPPDLIETRGKSVEIHCLHSISSYNVILWYKKTVAEGLVLLGYLFNKAEFKEPAFTNKTNLKGDATKDGSLIIKDLSVSDSAVYFCAASLHSALDSITSTQKLYATVLLTQAPDGFDLLPK
ncbi:hypothetical protein SRHO_G00138010 [Serrasalmus rhombeus]